MFCPEHSGDQQATQQAVAWVGQGTGIHLLNLVT